MPRKYLTFRRCQECRAVHPASAFKRSPRSDYKVLERWTICPSCGYEALAWTFPRVEKPAAGEPSEGTN